VSDLRHPLLWTRARQAPRGDLPASAIIPTVLISEPQSFRQRLYFPYIWAILKSECDRAPELGRINWLEPIFLKGDAATLLEPYGDTPPDVLGLSCYTWNWELQCEVARRVKAQNPGCLVIAGGPHPDYKDPDFFRKHPYVDAVAVKDGEIGFRKILGGVVRGDLDLRAIAGMYLPGGATGHQFTGPAQVPVRFEQSPYVAQSAYYERLVERFQGRLFDVVWETNRGCPYACNFCDWGSATMSKVRQFDIERVAAEVDWFSKMKVNGIMLADANFGISPRDLEIADLLIEARNHHGHPRFVHYSPAKNNPDRTVAIARKFVVNGISPLYPFAIQHTNENVLAAADRANISVDKQRQVAKAVVASDIPTLVQLIVGIPGDTYELWKSCLTDLMDWGLHDNYQVFSYALLPNAPAADAEFRQRWDIETIQRQVPMEGSGQRDADDTDALLKVDLIVKSKTFSRDDWVRMRVYTAFVRALHSLGLMRLPAIYMHFSHGVGYREFYDRLIEDHFGQSPLYRTLTEHFQAFLGNDEAMEDVPFEPLAERRLQLEAGRWLFVSLVWDFDRQFAAMKEFLQARFPLASNLGSAVDYQRNLMLTPDYDQRTGKSFRTDCDWRSYHEKARLLTRYEPLAEPEPAGARVVISDAGVELDWTGLDATGRWLGWLNRTRELQRTLSTSFRNIRVEPFGTDVRTHATSGA
jgi:putative methyltransferase